MQGGGEAVWPAASLLSVCRCSGCFSAPAALAERRQRTETRPTSFILHPGMEVMQESSLAQNKSLGVTDGVAEQEGNQLSLKVFHLIFHLEKAAVGALLMTSPARLFQGYVRHSGFESYNNFVELLIEWTVED